MQYKTVLFYFSEIVLEAQFYFMFSGLDSITHTIHIYHNNTTHVSLVGFSHRCILGSVIHQFDVVNRAA